MTWETDRIIDAILFPPTWKTSRGEVLTPHEMETQHLLNCIKVCERRHSPRDGGAKLNNTPTYRAMVEELISRGVLKYAYLDLSVDERLNDWSVFE